LPVRGAFHEEAFLLRIDLQVFSPRSRGAFHEEAGFRLFHNLICEAWRVKP